MRCFTKIPTTRITLHLLFESTALFDALFKRFIYYNKMFLRPDPIYSVIFVTGPLRQIIVYIDDPHTIEDMARWFEFRWNFGYAPKIKK